MLFKFNFCYFIITIAKIVSFFNPKFGFENYFYFVISFLNTTATNTAIIAMVSAIVTVVVDVNFKRAKYYLLLINLKIIIHFLFINFKFYFKVIINYL